MKKNIIKRFWIKSTLSLLMVFVYLISLTYTSGVYALQSNDPVSVDYWDGTDNYTSLDDVLADLGSADENGYYHIKTANQLHAVIKYNGGENKYKLDNDLYFNENYEDYSTWDVTPPANNWDFTSAASASPSYSFSGTIDGGGHTIYGMYCNGANNFYSGLIGTVGNTTFVKNLNMRYLYIRAANFTGAIIGGNWYSSPQTTTITLSGCSVRDAYIKDVWNNGAAGGLIGLTTRATTVNNCAVTDVTIKSCAAATDPNAYGCMGSFVGGLYNSTNASTSVFNQYQAKIL